MTIIEGIQKDAKTARWIGILLIITGILALIAPFAVGISVAIMIGVLLVIGGIGQIVLTFRAGSIGSGIMMFLLGALSMVTGIYMLSQPAAALAALTLFLAAYFIVTGILEVVAAFGARPASGWGWFLFSGILSVLLGGMIWAQFPLSGIWAVGILVGIRLFFSGLTLFTIGGAVKSYVARAAE